MRAAETIPATRKRGVEDMKMIPNPIRRAGLASTLLLALLLGACGSAPTQQGATAATPTDANAQQREALRGYVIAMTQRDELYESFSGMRRGEPMFAAAKESIGNVYRDPVVLDWMVDQISQDRAGFAKRFGSVMMEGFARANDDAAWKMLRPVGSALGRLDAQQCAAYVAETRGGAGGRGASMSALVRRMQPAELNEFFDGFRLALRAGIQREPLRPMASSAQVAAALASVPNSVPIASASMNECSAVLVATQAVQNARGDTRSHLLSVMLASAGLGAQREISKR
jgi:hypothetical protein